MTTQPTPIRSLEDDVQTYLDLTDRIEDLTAQRDAVKTRLRAAGEGKHDTSLGVTVTVTGPPRAFNLDKAWTFLSDEQRAVCVAPDARKVKAQLPPVLLDQCMDDGKGDPRVTVK